MAQKRQRAKDRKRKNRDTEPGKLDDASDESVGPDDASEEPVDLHKAGDDGAVVELERELDGDGDTGALDEEQLGAGGVGSTELASAPPTKGKPGPRLVNFIKACWAELQRVQWPDRRQVGQATAVVLGFVVIAGAFLGFADFLAQKLIDLIL